MPILKNIIFALNNLKTNHLDKYNRMAKKASTPSTSAPKQVETLPPSVETTTDVKEKKSRKSKVPKTTEEEVKVAVEPVVPEVSEDNVVLECEQSMLEKTNNFMTRLQCLGLQITALKTDYRVLEKQWSKELRSATKKSNKGKKKSGNRAPSGFVKPTKISDELAIFLGKPLGSEMARTEATSNITQYVRDHKLQNKDNGRIILADDKLRELLKLNDDVELTYFNLQRYMSPHFAKSVKAVPQTA